MAVQMDQVLSCLAEQRPIFHSEADFQHGLAWQFRCMNPDSSIRLETRPFRGVRLDLLVHVDGVRIAIELKYLLAGFNGVVAGEKYELPSQAAQDISRHDVVKDVVRLERLVAEGWADVGWSVTLTNDSGYWRPGRKLDPIDASFRLHEGRLLSGTLGWAAHAGSGTTHKRDLPLALTGTYECLWRDYSTVTDARGREAAFRYLCLAVAGTEGEQAVDSRTNATVAEADPRLGLLLAGANAREEILEAAKMLAAHAHDGTFTLTEIIAEIRRRGSRYAEGTVRTHVVSRMCVNAPDHHATVYADLERVGPARYRLVG
ncbi:hypothetical protein GCM10011609_48980 [Lentzea pudingi]|uniref:DUF7669 domain-containing protein n=1 Tax=Lentzea pudingi TaxID=1789439 RepID=A0ABQ2I8X5_9PSEU|nr:hypothetical protein [Lentzea pudingi]GGN04018.1 hypothetical protein GCM10011609_48980 [Lentzea pudingi]